MDPDNGLRGCFNAHRNVVLSAYKKGCERLLVFEDDVVFENVENVNKALCNLKTFIESDSTWDIIYLGHAAMSPIYSTKYPGIVTASDLRYMHAIVWSRRGMANFLHLAFTGEQLDASISNITNAFAAYPMIAYQNDFTLSGKYSAWYIFLNYLRGVISASQFCRLLEFFFYSTGKLFTLCTKQKNKK